MKLLHVIASVNPAGGGPIEGVIRQDAATREEGVRHIASLDPPDAPYLRDLSIPVHPLGARLSGIPPLRHWGYAPDFVPWLKAHVREYDAVVVNGLWNYASFGASRVLPKSDIPYFVFSHGMMDPWFRRTYPLKHFAKQAFWLVGEGRLLAGAKAVLFTCEEERLQASGQFFGHKYNEMVVGYGASPPPARTPGLAKAFRAAVPRLADKRYLLFLGRIHPKKGCDLLIQSFGKVAGACSDLDLVIAGPDQAGWVPSLTSLAARCGVADRIHFSGPLYGDEKWGALYNADAFVLPSHQENFGIAVAEALGCSTPVIISDKVNIWREIESAGAGLVEDDTASGTARALTRWLEMPSNAKAAMAHAAAALFKSKFDVTKTGPALMSSIRGCL